jgi:hypothetical protein
MAGPARAGRRCWPHFAATGAGHVAATGADPLRGHHRLSRHLRTPVAFGSILSRPPGPRPQSERGRTMFGARADPGRRPTRLTTAGGVIRSGPQG